VELIGELLVRTLGGIFGQLKRGDWVMALLIALFFATGTLLVVWFVTRQ
jgi:hypothetical protein